jgi:putative ABC transport system permease protein
MLALIRMSLRNLFRQKRRNLLLGSAIAVGVLLLVVANSFSRGISDVMINKVLRWVTGHVTVAYNERSRMASEIFRDKDRINAILDQHKDVILQREEAIGAFVKAIGVGKADNLMLIGLDFSAAGNEKSRKETEEAFRLIGGNWDDLNNSTAENPLIISQEKARYLGVKIGDILRIRLRNIYSQDQSARATVMGIVKSDNIFMQPVAFIDMQKIKDIMGFDAHSTGILNLIIKDPMRNAQPLADALHKQLNASLAVIPAAAQKSDLPITVLGYRSDPDSRDKLSKLLTLRQGAWDTLWKDKTALVSAPLAQRLRLKPGSSLEVRYTDKWGNANTPMLIKVGGIFDPQKVWGENTILANDEKFYEQFYEHWPRAAQPNEQAAIPGTSHTAYALLAPEWILLPRTLTTEDLEKKYQDMGKKKQKATLIDVRTMYEAGKMVLQLEGVLNLITLTAALILLFITLIGVINTLRMTIRERTREIGTIRAIGMQQKDVRNLFLFESFFLALFASIAGVILALLIMWGLSSITLRMDDNPLGMMLVNGHLYFLPTIWSVLGNMLLVLVLVVVTAFFPARRAAKLSPVEALRHTE